MRDAFKRSFELDVFPLLVNKKLGSYPFGKCGILCQCGGYFAANFSVKIIWRSKIAMQII